MKIFTISLALIVHYAQAVDFLQHKQLALINVSVYETNLEEIRKKITPLGLEILDMSGRPDEAGYFALALKNENSKKIIMAHRGTFIDSCLPNKSIFSIEQCKKFTSTDLIDVLMVATNQWPNQIDNADDFYHRIADNNPGYTIINTGHSLGTIYAQKISIENDLECVIFEAPGIKHLLKDLSNFEKNKHRVKVYNSAPNIINTQGEHYADMTQIIFSTKSSWDPELSWDIQEYVTYTLSQHDILELYKNFNNQAPVINWPQGFDAGFIEYKSMNNFSHWLKMAEDAWLKSEQRVPDNLKASIKKEFINGYMLREFNFDIQKQNKIIELVSFLKLIEDFNQKILLYDQQMIKEKVSEVKKFDEDHLKEANEKKLQKAHEIESQLPLLAKEIGIEVIGKIEYEIVTRCAFYNPPHSHPGPCKNIKFVRIKNLELTPEQQYIINDIVLKPSHKECMLKIDEDMHKEIIQNGENVKNWFNNFRRFSAVKKHEFNSFVNKLIIDSIKQIIDGNNVDIQEINEKINNKSEELFSEIKNYI